MLPECRNVGIISSMLVSGIGPPRDSTEVTTFMKVQGGIRDVYVVRICSTLSVPCLKEGTGVNRKDTQKKTTEKGTRDTEKDALKKTQRGQSSQRAAAASKLVYLSWPLGGPPRMGAASAAYCHCALSAVSIVKAYRRGRKGHPGSMYMSYVRTYIAPVRYLILCHYTTTYCTTNS